MDFSKLKEDFLSKPDKSGIGGIDQAIKNLIDLINRNKNYYTTSSCAGRIVLMKETGKKQENVFIFVTHKKASTKEIETALKMNKQVNDLIYLKEESCIMHVACKDLISAQALVSLARNSGWKKSGIISMKKDKTIIECISTEVLATPISNKGKMLIPQEYLGLLVKECNTKLSRTREKIKNLEKIFKSLK